MDPVCPRCCPGNLLDDPDGDKAAGTRTDPSTGILSFFPCN